MFSLKRWTLRGNEHGRPQIADPPDLAVLLRCRPCIIQRPPPPSAAPASLEVVCELAAVPEYLQQVVCCSQITQFVEELQRSEGLGEPASRRRRSAGWHAPRPCHRATIAAPSSRQWGLVEGRSNSCACLLVVILEVDRSCLSPPPRMAQLPPILPVLESMLAGDATSLPQRVKTEGIHFLW